MKVIPILMSISILIGDIKATHDPYTHCPNLGSDETLCQFNGGPTTSKTLILTRSKKEDPASFEEFKFSEMFDMSTDGDFAFDSPKKFNGEFL